MPIVGKCSRTGHVYLTSELGNPRVSREAFVILVRNNHCLLPASLPPGSSYYKFTNNENL